MSNRAQSEWRTTFAVATVLILCAVLMRYLQTPALAGGGSWETDGILANTTEGDNERLVIVDTKLNLLLIYKTDGVGQFRLCGARNYRYDVEMKDTAGIDEIEKKGGINFVRSYEMYQERKQP